MNEEQLTFYYLGVALAIGLLIGIERGWKEREVKEGMRAAGVRTYGLIGLLGGVLALLAGHVGALILGLAFVAVTGTLTIVYFFKQRNGDSDVGITSLVAALLTFALGALATMGEVAIASGAAVVTTLLLSYKPLLHRWVSALEEEELRAGIKLLLISVVLLPILPNQSYGPWHAINPYAIWWMVVLTAAISFVGYFAIKIAGARRGTIFTALFSGLASSTVLTLHFSRMANRNRAMTPILATGILLACGTMFPRILLVASIFNTNLFRPLIVPVVLMALLTYIPAIWYWRSQSHENVNPESLLKNPLELKTALTFGAFLALIMLLGKTLQAWFGDMGVMALSTVSGVTDVDAITLSLARMSNDDLALRVATMGIVLAASANCITKGCMAAVIGGREIGLRVGLPLLATSIGGLIAVWLLAW
jgi:uncharacterized membrane protein (DUF4010 family)